MFDLSQHTPDVRRLGDMKEVIYDQSWLASADKNIELYYMYRGLEEKDGLRYDITVIPPGMLGSEFVKTKGHYHIKGYQEIYTILEGSAFFVFQKTEENAEDTIVDVYSVQAKTGQTVIIPPFAGHATINPSETEVLKMANWISAECKSDYGPFERLRGGCYYYTEDGWIKNSHYKSIPDLRFEEPLQSIPEDLNFLKIHS